jgi:hypothetical protein
MPNTSTDKIHCKTVPTVSNQSFQVEDYIERQTLLLEFIKKAKAQACVALSDDFLDYDTDVTHYYLWALSDSLELTTTMLENLIDDFMEIKKFIL